MSLIVNNIEVETVIANIIKSDGTIKETIEIEELYTNSEQVYISTIFIEKPTLVADMFTYDTESKQISVNNYLAEAMVESGDIEATNAGDYSVTYTLKKGYAWIDPDYPKGNFNPITLDWKINKKQISIPTLTGSFTFDTANHSGTVSGYDATWMTQSGTVTASVAGTYPITWTLLDVDNTCWSDGTNGNKSASWSIAKRVLTIPSLTNTSRPTTGSAVSPTFNNENSTYITRTGTSSSASIGTWYVYWNLKYPASTTWTDGGTAQKSGKWSTYGGSVTFYVQMPSNANNRRLTYTTTYTAWGSLPDSMQCTVDGTTYNFHRTGYLGFSTPHVSSRGSSTYYNWTVSVSGYGPTNGSTYSATWWGTS